MILIPTSPRERPTWIVFMYTFIRYCSLIHARFDAFPLFRVALILRHSISQHFNPPLARDSGQIKTDSLSMFALVHLCDNRKSGRYIFYSCHLDSPRYVSLNLLWTFSPNLDPLIVFSVGNVLLTLFTAKGIMTLPSSSILRGEQNVSH